jgi:alpha-mannosidase
MDYIPPKDFDALIADWEKMRQNAGDHDRPPALRYSAPEQFLDAVTESNPDFETIGGERPNIWVYIHGPTHHHAVSAKREAGVVIVAAEMFSAIEALLAGSFEAYPTALLEQAWADSIYDDHGWGGNNGFITDEVFRRKLVAARDTGHDLLRQAIRSIAGRVQADLPNATPVVVFNDLSWSRTDPVTCRLTSAHSGVKVMGADGAIIPHQLRPAGNGLSHDVMFIAEDVPSIGYKTYYLAPDAGAALTAPPPSVTITDTTYENAFYRVALAPGGIQRLYDKQLQHEVIETYDRHTRSDYFWREKFLGAEVFITESVGNGAHEYGYVQQPSFAADFDKVSRHKPAWTITESGAVYTVFSFSQQLTHCLVVETLTFYHAIKRIDCEISLLNWDATKSRELRMVLPLNMPGSHTITYEVPFGVVEVGRDEVERAGADKPVYEGGPTYNEDNRTMRPREVQNFISASDENLGVTMSSSVAACDYLDPSTLRPAPYPILQPLLLASRKSCHSNGNWYVQGGDHHYLFSILSHPPGWENGYRYGIQANHPLHAVVRQMDSNTPSLPSEQSFVSASANNVLISALKKCDDDQSVILRCYDIEGRDADCGLRFAFAIEGAQRTNIIEENGEPISFKPQSLETRIDHHAIETFKLIPRE